MEEENRRVTMEEAAIMALLLHSRDHFRLSEAISTALHLRCQFNFLYDHGIRRDVFQKLLDEVQNEDITGCWH